MDRSYLYGDALFETIRVERGRKHRVERHIARLCDAASHLGFGRGRLEEALAAIEAIDPAEEGLWRVTVTRDPEGAPFGGEGGVTVVRRDLQAVAIPRLVALPGWYLPDDPLADFKTTSYMRWVEARRRAELLGADDAVMVSADGRVGETSTANLFVRFGARVVTPRAVGILPGVTRAAVLDHASAAGIDVEEGDLAAEDLQRADEIVCTSSGILAVSAASLDGAELEEELGPTLHRFLCEGWE